MRKKVKKTGVIIFGLLVVVIIGSVYNKFGSEYEELNDVDKTILSELDQYWKANHEAPIWPDFELEDKTILAVNGRWGKAYLINPDKEVRNLFAQEIKMPDSFDIKVYRISSFAPQLLSYRLPGNFNVSDKKYSMFGNELFYTRYDSDSVGKRVCDSSHYITFLSHESFHYYMQDKWQHSGRFTTDNLSEEDLDLLEAQYVVLAKIQTEINNSQPNKDELLELAKEYIRVVEIRMVTNPAYVERELMAETEEGTATYIGMKASEIVDYDFGIMRFSQDGAEAVEVQFDGIIPVIKNGKMNPSTLASDWVYQTGAQLCVLLDELEVPNWKENLNSQTAKTPVTLYALLKEYVQSQL